MGADGARHRGKRWLAAPIAIAIALVILTVAAGVLGGGKPGTGNQPAPGFPQGEPGFPRSITSPSTHTVAPPASPTKRPRPPRAEARRPPARHRHPPRP